MTYSTTLSSNIGASQPSNRNFLSPIGFKFILSKCPKVDFFSNTASIPSISLGSAIQVNPYKDIALPGDKLLYDDFQMNFLVDENMENYIQIHKWMEGLGFPENIKQFGDLAAGNTDFPDANPQMGYKNIYSDGTLQILNSNYNVVKQIKFLDLFPVSLSSLDFNATDRDYNYFTAVVTFKYTIYNILDANGNVV